ncbi:MAG: RagB/SusD family nutrient uptake outer membrane protein, partial [Ferruginibacter sp.]
MDIDPPVNSITTSQVFSNIEDARKALIGIYSNMALSGAGGDGLDNPTNGGLTISGGMSADELIPFNAGGADPDVTDFYTNTLLGTNSRVLQIWFQLYPFLFHTNAFLEGLQASPLPQSVKDRFTGEAKFLRALINFYLVNLYGDVPLITTTDYESNALLPRTPSAEVYLAIINDLKDAKNLLPADYSSQAGERVRANKWAAAALLARVYLYTMDYAGAEAEATSIISNTAMYSLAGEPEDVFLKNSLEAIL